MAATTSTSKGANLDGATPATTTTVTKSSPSLSHSSSSIPASSSSSSASAGPSKRKTATSSSGSAHHHHHHNGSTGGHHHHHHHHHHHNRNPNVLVMDEAARSNDLPNDAKVLAQILKSMGVDETEARVVPQLLEFMHRYVREVLEDAAVYAMHAGKTTGLDLDDVRLAIQSRVNYSFTQPPPREFLIELAHTKNAIPLPFPPLPRLLSLAPVTSPSAAKAAATSMATVVLPPPQFRVQPLEWEWPIRSDSKPNASSSTASSSSPSSSSAPALSSSSSASALSSSSSSSSIPDDTNLTSGASTPVTSSSPTS